MHAQTDTVPALTDDELEFILDGSLVRDANDVFIDNPFYVPTVWAAHAVCEAINLKLSKAAAMVDFNADGATISQSQITANLTAARRRWMAALINGSV